MSLAKQRRKELKNRQLARVEAKLVKVAGRLISNKVGRYQHKITRDMIELSRHGNGVTTIKAIALAQFGSARRDQQAYVRKRSSEVVNELLRSGVLCYPEFEVAGYHRLKAIKFYLGDSEDKIQLPLYLKRMLDRKQISAHKYDGLIELQKHIDDNNEENSHETRN